MSGTKALILALVVVALSLANPLRPLNYLAYSLVAAVVLARLWSWTTVVGLKVTRELRPTRAQVGQTVEERITVRFQVPVPRTWVEVHDLSTLPGHAADRVLGLGFGRVRTWSVRTECSRRGEYAIGPLSVTGTDPFGLFSTRRPLGKSRTLLVYPRTVDVGGFALPAISLPGGTQRLPGWHHVTPHASGVREYQAGDPLNRIHWPSSARTSRLMVKEFDLDPVPDVWLFIDLAASAQRGLGDESTEEYAIVAGASLAQHFLRQGRAVGLVASGGTLCVLTPDRGERQLLRVLEELAVISAEGTSGLAETLAAEGGRCTRRAAVVVITPSVDEGWVTGLDELRHRGIRAAAVLLEAGTFGSSAQLGDGTEPLREGPGGSLAVVAALAAAEIPVHLVKCGDRLERALSGSGAGHLRVL